MKSIDLRHRLAAVLLAVCLVVCCALPAFATSANIVLGRLGSLHVRLYDTHNDVPLRGGELTIRVLPGKQLLMTGAAETVCEGTTEV
mgnify:FL=1